MSCSSKNTLLETKIGSLTLPSPVIVASGILPHDEHMWKKIQNDGAGGICTKGLTLNKKDGNSGTRIYETYCGLLNSIGLENPGIKTFLDTYIKDLHQAKGKSKLILNLAVETLSELEKSLKLINKKKDYIDVVELNISCPNVDGGGMLWGENPKATKKAVSCARSLWEKSLWVKLTPQAKDIKEIAVICEEEKADAVVVANTYLGMAIDINAKKPVFKRKFAGLSGPAIFPMALHLVWKVSEAVNIPVIGCGGITQPEDAIAMMLAGATAVEIGSILFKNLNSVKDINNGIKNYLLKHNYSLKEIIGIAKRG